MYKRQAKLREHLAQTLPVGERYYAVVALGAVQNAGGLPALLEALRDPDTQVRRKAIDVCVELQSGGSNLGSGVATLFFFGLTSGEGLRFLTFFGFCSVLSAPPAAMAGSPTARFLFLGLLTSPRSICCTCSASFRASRSSGSPEGVMSVITICFLTFLGTGGGEEAVDATQKQRQWSAYVRETGEVAFK